MRDLKILIISILVIFLVTSLSLPSMALDNRPVVSREIRYNTHAVIRIDSDADFTSANGVTGGSGTENDPYIISGWEIDADGYSAAIYIGNTTKYFKIVNCLVENAKAISGFFYVGSGIEINNALNGIIENVESTANYFYGIYVRDSQNIVIRDGNIHDNGNDGIYVDNSPGTVIAGTQLTGNGIRINNADNSKVDGNTLSEAGISLSDSENLYVANNSVSDVSTYGIKFYRVGYSTIYGNTIVNASKGIELDTCSSTNIIEGNNITESDDGIYLYMSRNAIVRHNTLKNNTFDAQYHNIYVSFGSSVILENNTIDGGLYGIYLSSSTSNIIKYNSLKGNYEGIHLEDSDSNEVKHNTCLGSGTAFTRDGIYAKNSEHLKIRDNNCSWLGYGIDLYRSDYAYVYGNILDHNSDGIAVSFSNYTNISRNEIKSSGEDGINMQNSNMGRVDNNTIGDSHDYNIFVANGKGHILENNTLTNASTGITLDHVSSGIFESVGGGIVKFNNMHGNDVGLYVESSSKVLIQHNELASNIYEGMNVSSSSWITIKNNDVHGNEKGISVWDSSVVVIKEQNSSYNDIGFYLGKSSVSGENIRAFNNSLGIYAYNSTLGFSWIWAFNNSQSGIVLENNCSNSNLKNIFGYDNGEWGLKLSNVTKVNVQDSKFFQNGKDGMFVNGTHLNFEYLEIYENHYAGVYFEHFEYLYFANSSITYNNYEGLYLKEGWRDSNYYPHFSTCGKFEHLNISYNGKNGVTLKNLGGYGATYNSTSYFYIAHSVISHNQGHGIYVYRSYNASIINTTVKENLGFGIFFDDEVSDDDKISYTTVSKNEQGGIYLLSSGVIVYNNTISHNNGPGLFLNYSGLWVYNNTISYNNGSGIYAHESSLKAYNNTISRNQGDGIRIERIWSACPYYYIYNNSISNNAGCGIYVSEVNDLKVHDNLILNNTGYGIYLSQVSEVVEIYGNSFYYNNGAGDEYDSSHIQAYDDKEHYWNTTKGNFWAEWTEPDRNGDGIVDEPYLIDGPGGAKDYKPLTEAEVPIPEISTMLLVVIIVGAVVMLRRKR